MRFVPLYYVQWMFVFQQFYMATFAQRTKRVMTFFQFEYVLDASILLIDMCYLIIILRDYRANTFLLDLTQAQEAQIFWKQYSESPVDEHILLLIIAILLWIKAFS